jgi:soluble lytic murein transglycosylase-like protein
LKFAIQFALTGALLAAAIVADAADLAVLRNGNTIRHERREVVGAVTRLYLSDSASGYIEIPTDQIQRFEKDTAPPPPKVQPRSQPAIAAVVARPFAASPPSTTRLSRQGLSDVINGAGERHQIDPDFINSVIRAESGFHQNAVSKKGAQGLMQLMPGTASELGVNNVFDPNANVEGGTKYLRELLEKYNFDVPKALAAYNAGPKRVDQYHGIPPYYETQTYIARIIRDFNRQKLAENPGLARKSKTASAHASRQSKGAGEPQPHKATIASSVPKGPEPTSK